MNESMYLLLETSWWLQTIWKIIKIGSFPQVGMNIKKHWNHQLAYFGDYWMDNHLIQPYKIFET